MAHARLSPSSAERWMTCAGSVPLSDGVVDEGSEFAAEGTAAHELAERILGGAEGAALVGQKAENGVLWTAEMLDDVMKYVTAVWDIVNLGGELHIEQKVEIGHFTGEGKWVDELTGEEVPAGTDGAVWEPACGTSDAVILLPDELVVGDLKFGRGVVVDAKGNKQLMLYALGALKKFDSPDVFDPLLGGTASRFKRARLIISQPRLGALSEWTLTIDDLLLFAGEVGQAAALVDTLTTLKRDLGVVALEKYLHPSEKACKFCKVKGDCPKLQSEVLDLFDTVDPSADVVVGDELQAEQAEAGGNTVVRVVDLAEAMKKAPLVEAWLKAVRARVESELLAGRAVPGYKLVQGRQGPRQWSDAEEAEKTLKGFRLKTEEMYDLSLISPATAEKLAKAKVLGPRQWTKLQTQITRSEGKLSVAPADDDRPAVQVAAVTDDFDVVNDQPSAAGELALAETVDDLL